MKKEMEQWFEDIDDDPRNMGEFSQDIYNEKYDLDPDPIYPKEDFIERDERFDHLAGDISFLDHQNEIAHICLIPSVPDDTKDIFSVAKKIYKFAYFDYDLFTQAQHYSLLAVESAIKEKHKKIFGEPDGHLSMGNAYKQLIEKGVIDEEVKGLYESSHKLRNSFSHPDFKTITGFNTLSIQRSAEAINYLWDKG